MTVKVWRNGNKVGEVYLRVIQTSRVGAYYHISTKKSVIILPLNDIDKIVKDKV